MLSSDHSAEPAGERVISWDEPQAIQFEYLPARPVVSGIAMRPEKLSSLGKAIFYRSKADWYEYLHRRLTHLAVATLKHHPAQKVVSDMTLGWDTALAEAALQLKLPLLVALPYRGLQSHWQFEHRQRFARILSKAEKVINVSKGSYKPWKLKKAVFYKVQHSKLIFALWDELDEHTREGVKQAQAHAHTINLWPSWVKYSGLMKE